MRRRRLFARALGLLGLGTVTLLSTGCYIVDQGTQFLTYQARARSLDRAEELWPQYKPLFEETEKIRRFGEKRMGLEMSRNYTSFVKLDRNYLVTVVSAARPTSFERKGWWFPVVGEVPYKGFYRERKAARLAEGLREKGWETLLRRVDAFSSLGYFRDPLYSFMFDYHQERLANLLLHEMVHATIWIADDAPLNEAMATFLGDRGALEYLAETYGEESEVYREGVLRQEESDRFVAFMRELTVRLEGLYDRELPEQEVLERKGQIIEEERERFRMSYEEWFSSDRYRFFLEREINNAYVDLFRTYNEDIALIESLYEREGRDLRRLLDTLGEVSAAEEPRSRLLELIAFGRE